MMRGLVEGTVQLTPDLVAHELNCLVCDACTAACPAGVHMAPLQVAVRTTIAHVRDVVTTEVNAVTDNPTFFPEDDVVLHAGNFHRKVLSVPGFVESTGGHTETGGTRGGPRAKLYRRGDAKLLHPALLRPATEAELRP